MIDTQKLLYILPDLAYLAEFLPGKQPNTFTVQSFKQFNGKLMDGNKLIPENIQKLAKRVQDKVVEGELAVVLADEVFTNTIISVEKKNEAEVKQHLQEEVIPSLHISRESHLMESFILSEYKGVFKVQLSTVQHSALAPLTQAFADQKVSINKIYPLSWTLKSAISLEPSASLVEMGKNLFLAKHYIGVDQPMVDSVENLDRFVEAIKTLKGTEPSLQTIYLLSSKKVEDELKEKLGDLIPVQQVAQEEGSDSKLPGFIEKAMTLAMRTIAIDEYEIPEFGVKDVNITEELKAKLAEETASEEIEEVEEVDAEVGLSADLPKPGEVSAKDEESSEKEKKVEVEEETIEEEEKEEEKAKNLAEEVEEKEQPTETIDEKEEAKPEKKPEEKTEEKTEEKSTETQTPATTSRFYTPAAAASAAGATTITPHEKDDAKDEKDDDMLAVDLSKFSSKPAQKQSTAKLDLSKEKTAMKKTIKNDDGTKNLFKVILVGFGSFALTVALGVGIGFGVLKLSQPDSIRTPISGEPDIQVEEPEPIEEPTPTPMPEVEREDYSIRVVNATTKAGYAGQFASTLRETGYGKVDAKNAVDEYEEGFYILMAERDDVLIATLEEDLEIELIFSDEIAAEDPNEEFDAVLVLAK